MQLQFSHPSISDSEFVERIEQKKASFYRVAFGYTRNEDDALDATQEVLISMLTRLNSLQDPEAFWGWLSAMTANHCRNVLTRGRREAQIPEDDEGNSLLDAFESLDEQSVPAGGCAGGVGHAPG